MTSVVSLSGGFGYPSTTTALTDLLARAAEELDGADLTRLELRDLAGDLPDATLLGLPSERLDRALRAVEQADLIITASPVFRGSYAGLFKAFWDLVDPVAMKGKPVILGATGGSARHQLVIDQAMRPLFSYFGALVVPTAIYAAEEDWAAAGLPTPELADRARRAVAQAADLLPARATLRG
ncbi:MULTISPECIES: CE1759 family FMN reductase [unclassified Pseudactinotalea]|uniref:CE1759 family FMN reductase n=1 Tax=unclassified Pseudactinotalea TaxID=2649176 RepID=UPI0018835D46|nr:MULTISPECIES: CE1759 family FMN reductase [unclassified Pseudactinotalea]